jgi:hypothetical protein
MNEPNKTNTPSLEDLTTDLIYLRRDAGFIAERVYKKTNVFLSAIGGKQQDFDTIKTRLVSAINSLPDKQGAEALMVAFALSPEYASLARLTDRRKAYGEKIARKTDTIADREDSAMKELAITLLTARYMASPLPDGAPVMHDAIINERVEITTVVRDKLWVETREYYSLIPLMDDIGSVDVSSDIPAHVTANQDGVISQTSTAPNGLLHTFTFKEPLQRGKVTDFAFTMLPDGVRDDELILIEETRGFHIPTLSCSIEVMFLGEKPRLIWHYAQLPYFERPGKPTKQWLIDLKGGGSVRVEFSDLHGGLFSGIAWEW